jgi:hypothetical protein
VSHAKYAVYVCKKCRDDPAEDCGDATRPTPFRASTRVSLHLYTRLATRRANMTIGPSDALTHL